MGAAVSRRPYTATPLIYVVIVPGPSGSYANLMVGPGVTGHNDRHPTGRLGLRLRSGDLVGLSAPAAALRALHHVVRTLEHIVGDNGMAKPPAPPEGATGAKKGSTAATQHVPGQLTLF